MTEIRERVSGPTSAQSSARDPIDRWLDVFVRLLRVPRADASRIRDELEDHLRARVDDLMVTGLSEPEAVRAAVGELGETAELAKHFKSAVHSRRRPVMQTLLVGVAGASVAAGSLAILSPNGMNSPSGTTGVSSRAAAATSEIVEASGQPIEDRVFEAELRTDPDTGYTTLADAISAIEGLLDARVIAHHRPMLAGIGHTRMDAEFEPPQLKGLTLAQGLELLAVPLELEPTDSLAVYASGVAFELSTQSFFDRRDAVLIEYDVSGLLVAPGGREINPHEFRDTVVSLIEPSLWGERARIGMVSTTLLVSAHPRIHVQVEDLLGRVAAKYASQRAARLDAERRRHVSEIAKYSAEVTNREAGLAELEAELAAAVAARAAARERVYSIEHELGQADGQNIVSLRLGLSEARDELEAAEKAVSDTTDRMVMTRHNITITQGQIRQHESYLVALTDPAG